MNKPVFPLGAVNRGWIKVEHHSKLQCRSCWIKIPQIRQVKIRLKKISHTQIPRLENEEIFSVFISLIKKVKKEMNLIWRAINWGVAQKKYCWIRDTGSQRTLNFMVSKDLINEIEIDYKTESGRRIKNLTHAQTRVEASRDLNKCGHTNGKVLLSQFKNYQVTPELIVSHQKGKKMRCV